MVGIVVEAAKFLLTRNFKNETETAKAERKKKETRHEPRTLAVVILPNISNFQPWTVRDSCENPVGKSSAFRLLHQSEDSFR